MSQSQDMRLTRQPLSPSKGNRNSPISRVIRDHAPSTSGMGSFKSLFGGGSKSIAASFHTDENSINANPGSPMTPR